MNTENETINPVIFEILNDAMDNNTTKSICKGDKLSCLEITTDSIMGQEDVSNFAYIIVTKQDETLCRKITVHKEKANVLVCHALNANYEDLEIDVEDISKIFQVEKLVCREIIMQNWN